MGRETGEAIERAAEAWRVLGRLLLEKLSRLLRQSGEKE